MQKPELPSGDNYPDNIIQMYDFLKSHLTDSGCEQLETLASAIYAIGYQDGFKDMIYFDELKI